MMVNSSGIVALVVLLAMLIPIAAATLTAPSEVDASGLAEPPDPDAPLLLAVVSPKLL